MSDNFNDAAERTYTPARQAETDQHCREVSGCEGDTDRTPPTALDYCNGEMENCLKEVDRQHARIAELVESEVELQEGLYDYHRKVEALNDRIADLESTIADSEVTPLADAFFRAESEVARLTAQVAELERREAPTPSRERFERLRRMAELYEQLRKLWTEGDMHDAARGMLVEDKQKQIARHARTMQPGDYDPWPEGAAEAGGEG